ncbi:MAG: glycine-rich domain-containing protein, partial [Pseudohongiella sp.]
MPQAGKSAASARSIRTVRDASLWRWLARGLCVSVGLLVLAGLVIAQVPGPVNVRGTGGTITQVTSPVIGTGGTISTQGAYTVHVFNGNGTFVPPQGLSSLDVLVVAGGGGGGGTYGGGGGAGGLRWLTNVTVNQPSYAVVVGAGGAGGAGISVVGDPTGSGTKGGDSSFGANVAEGGGFGQGGAQNNSGGGGAGGSGGGGGGITAGTARPGG